MFLLMLVCSDAARVAGLDGYLRPGINRGKFSESEEKKISHLQALLGNRWSAIASYLPQRTDNDIKNYWNTHLKKKLKRIDGGHGAGAVNEIDQRQSVVSSPDWTNISNRGLWERRLQTDVQTAKKALCEALVIDVPRSAKISSSPLTGDVAGASPVDRMPTEMNNLSQFIQSWKDHSQKRNQSQTEQSTSSVNVNPLDNAERSDSGINVPEFAISAADYSVGFQLNPPPLGFGGSTPVSASHLAAEDGSSR